MASLPSPTPCGDSLPTLLMNLSILCKLLNPWKHHLDKGRYKKNPFFWGGKPFPNLFTHPPTPGFLEDLGKRKVKFGSKKAIFGVIWGGFEGFEPCLGISHPTHPHLGKISQKNVFFYTFPYRTYNKETEPFRILDVWMATFFYTIQDQTAAQVTMWSPKIL